MTVFPDYPDFSVCGDNELRKNRKVMLRGNVVWTGNALSVQDY